MPCFFDKHSLFHAPNETFSLVQSIQLSGKLSRLKNKHVRKNVHTSQLNANGRSRIVFCGANILSYKMHPEVGADFD